MVYEGNFLAFTRKYEAWATLGSISSAYHILLLQLFRIHRGEFKELDFRVIKITFIIYSSSLQ